VPHCLGHRRSDNRYDQHKTLTLHAPSIGRLVASLPTTSVRELSCWKRTGGGARYASIHERFHVRNPRIAWSSTTIQHPRLLSAWLDERRLYRGVGGPTASRDGGRSRHTIPHPRHSAYGGNAGKGPRLDLCRWIRSQTLPALTFVSSRPFRSGSGQTWFSARSCRGADDYVQISRSARRKSCTLRRPQR